MELEDGELEDSGNEEPTEEKHVGPKTKASKGYRRAAYTMLDC